MPLFSRLRKSLGRKFAEDRALSRAESLPGDFETWRPADGFDAIVFNESIGCVPGEKTRDIQVPRP